MKKQQQKRKKKFFFEKKQKIIKNKQMNAGVVQACEIPNERILNEWPQLTKHDRKSTKKAEKLQKFKDIKVLRVEKGVNFKNQLIKNKKTL